MGVRRFSIDDAKDQITEAYAPVVLAKVDEFVIRAVKFRGEFERWHAHEHEDEAFVVIEGEITFQTAAGDHILKPGEGIVIPKGVKHRPKASEAGPMSLALVIERAETKRLGD
jgi:quercetin dioxygenase-like cupin family protein